MASGIEPGSAEVRAGSRERPVGSRCDESSDEVPGDDPGPPRWHAAISTSDATTAAQERDERCTRTSNEGRVRRMVESWSPKCTAARDAQRPHARDLRGPRRERIVAARRRFRPTGLEGRTIAVVRVRDAVASDHAAVLALNNGATPHVNELSKDVFAWIAGHADYFRVAVDDSGVVGFVIALGAGLGYWG